MKRAWPVFLVFLAMGFGDVVGPLVTLVKETFNVSNVTAQLVPMTGFLMFGLLSVPMGLVQDRKGKKFVLILGLAVALLAARGGSAADDGAPVPAAVAVELAAGPVAVPVTDPLSGSAVVLADRAALPAGAALQGRAGHGLAPLEAAVVVEVRAAPPAIDQALALAVGRAAILAG